MVWRRCRIIRALRWNYLFRLFRNGVVWKVSVRIVDRNRQFRKIRPRLTQVRDKVILTGYYFIERFYVAQRPFPCKLRRNGPRRRFVDSAIDKFSQYSIKKFLLSLSKTNIGIEVLEIFANHREELKKLSYILRKRERKVKIS